MIFDVRDRYTGKLTYAANWYREYQSISFWPDLDFIGVQAYFPLAEDPGVRVSDLSRGWAPHLDVLSALSRRVQKPVLFTEIGYRSVREAAIEPWRWASRQEAALAEPDDGMQAELYRAFFSEVWPKPWLAGASFWRWHTDAESRGSNAEAGVAQAAPGQVEDSQA